MKRTAPSALSEPDRDDLLPEYHFDYRKARPNRFAGESTVLPQAGRSQDLADIEALDRLSKG